MTNAQADIWLTLQMDSESSNTFVEVWDADVDGPFDPAAFRAAVHEFINRHESLRLTFAGDAPRVADGVTLGVPLTDVSGSPGPGTAADAMAAEEARTPFDLAAGPLLRARVVKLAAGRHRVLLSVHHIACDDGSQVRLLRELAAAYTARVRRSVAAPPPAPGFGEHLAELSERAAGPEGTRALAYWRERFATPAPPLELPTDRPRPARRTYAGGSVSLPLGEALSDSIRAAAACHGVAPDVWLLAAFHALLHRLTGQTDVAVGTASVGRADEERPLGRWAELLPVRVAIEPERPFRELVESVGRTAREVAENSRLPAGESGPARQLAATFDVRPGVEPLTFGDATARFRRASRQFLNFDLEVGVTETDGQLVAEFAYNAGLFDEATVTRWAGHFRTLLGATAADPNGAGTESGLPPTRRGAALAATSPSRGEVKTSPPPLRGRSPEPSPVPAGGGVPESITPADPGAAVGRLPLLTPDELRQILDDFNDSAADYPRDRCTHDLIAEQAARTPDAVAVVGVDVTLTYAELDARANRLAHHLRELGVGPDVPVGLCVRRSAEMVVAMLGIWKAGGAYVPLDPDFPADRLKLYLEDSGAAVVVTEPGLKNRLPAGVGRTVDLDADREAIAARPAAPPARVGSPSNLAYMIYTSGSTGTPNGVPIEHRSLVNLLASFQRNPGLTPADVIAAVSTISFDIHHIDLWFTLSVGARVVVLTRDIAVDGVRLARELDRVGATILQATPASWRLLMAADWAGRPGLKAFAGGEAMPPDLAAWLLDRVGELWNMYGPTETTVYSTIHRVTDPAGPIPIGRPVANTQVYILDKLLQPVPVGVVGEIYIGGGGLARGYRNRPELTAARFVGCPFRPGERMYKTGDLGRFRPDGVVECLGRVDHQVKVNGHRIELGELEAALAKHPSVAAAAARVWGQPPQLAAYAVARPGEPRSPEKVRAFLRERLPSYMVPGSVTFLDSLPLTPNGKVDRKALPEPAAAPPDHEAVPPRTDAERDLLAVWAEVLGRQGIGVTDDFFELGGTSLHAAEVLGLIRRRLGHTVPLGAMYEAGTVEKMATLLQQRLEVGTTGPLVPLQTGGNRPPLFMIAGIGGHVFTFHKFARLLGSDYPVYGLKAVGVDGDRRPPESFEEAAAEYVREITAARPHGPYVISGYSVGAHVAVEVALQLQGLGHEVPLVIVFDMAAPGFPNLSVPRRMALHARNVFRRGGGVRYAMGRVRNLGIRFLRLVGLERLLFPHHPSLNALPQEALRDVWVALQRASRRYRPRGRLAGGVALFRSEQPYDMWDAVIRANPTLGWERLADGPVEVFPVSRGHLEVFHDGNIARLAREVAGAIDRAAGPEAAGAETPARPQLAGAS